MRNFKKRNILVSNSHNDNSKIFDDICLIFSVILLMFRYSTQTMIDQ